MLDDAGHRIVTSYWKKPIPERRFDWGATLDDYDGAEDSPTRGQIGHGETELEAIKDLLEKLDE